MAREMYLVGVSEEELQPPAPPEKPQTPKGKWENFWYHYKWVTLGVTAAVVVLVVLIVQMVNRPNPDYDLILVTKTVVAQDAMDKLQADLEKYARDVNGNGKVEVRIQSLYIGGNDQMTAANQTKLVTMLGAGEGMLFAFDEESYQERIVEQLEHNEDGAKFFDVLKVEAAGISEDGRYWNWKDDPFREDETVAKGMPENLYFGIRRAAGTAAGKSKQHDQCMELLRAYILKQPLQPAKAPEG